MNNQKFDKILNERIDKIKKVLSSKAEEYSSDKDRLHNFKVAARMNKSSPAKALWGMLTKHLVSVLDMVEMDVTNKYYIDEKVGDCINYFILLEAIFIERLEEHETNKTSIGNNQDN